MYGCDGDDEVTSFIAKCQIMVQNWVALSIDRFIGTPKLEVECGFNFPQPPMKSTNILYPLENDMSETKIRNHKDNWKNISKHLNDMKEGEDISFDQLLTNLGITEQNYYLAIRFNLHNNTKNK